MLLDDVEKNISLNLSSHHKNLLKIPETMNSIWSNLNYEIDLNQFTNIIIFGSERFFNHFDLLQQIFKNIYEIPIIFHNEVNQKIVIHAPTLIITFNLERSHPIFDYLMKDNNDENKTIIVNSDLLAIPNLSKNNPEFLFIEQLKEEPVRFEYLISFLLKVVGQSKSISSSSIDISNICCELKELIIKIDLEIPTSRNPAKRLAGQMVDRMIVIIGSNFLCPIAKYWKEQLNNIARTWAQYEFLPEMCKVSINGIFFPEKILSQSIFIFLNSNLLDNEKRNEISSLKENILSAGIGTDEVQARGENYLSQILNLCIFGEFVSFYLAAIYGVDSC